MQPHECAEKVLKWAIDQALTERMEYLKADCDAQARQTAFKVWEEHNPDDGVGCFSTNPYAPKEHLIKERERIAKRMGEANDLLEFVKKIICSEFKMRLSLDDKKA